MKKERTYFCIGEIMTRLRMFIQSPVGSGFVWFLATIPGTGVRIPPPVVASARERQLGKDSATDSCLYKHLQLRQYYRGRNVGFLYYFVLYAFGCGVCSVGKMLDF